MTQLPKTGRAALFAGVSLMAATGFLALRPDIDGSMAPGSAAYAEDHDHGDHDGGPKGPGGGHSDGGHDDGGHDDGGHEGGHSGSKDGSGGTQTRAGQGDGDCSGSGQRPGGARPVWAREGIPEVELGRLNVARSPDRVLDRAYLEALATIDGQTAAFYSQPLDAMISDLSLNWDSVTIIDSPLQNLALLRDALDGTVDLSGVGISNDRDTLMAVFLGTASDKGMPISADTAIAVSAILEEPLSLTEAAALAADAERVRIAILAGHG